MAGESQVYSGCMIVDLLTEIVAFGLNVIVSGLRVTQQTVLGNTTFGNQHSYAETKEG